VVGGSFDRPGPRCKVTRIMAPLRGRSGGRRAPAQARLRRGGGAACEAKGSTAPESELHITRYLKPAHAGPAPTGRRPRERAARLGLPPAR